MRSRVTMLWSVVFTLALGAGCKKTDAPPPESNPGVSVPAPAAVRPILLDAGFLRLVPLESVAIAASASPASLFPKLGMAEILAVLSKEFPEPMGFPERVTLGALETASWTNVGLDPNAVLGAVLVDASKGVGAFYIGVSDATVFEGALRKAAALMGESVEVRHVGGGAIFFTKDEDEVALVVRDGWLAVVVGDRGRDVSAVSDRIAGLLPEHSIAEKKRYEAAFAGADSGRDVAAWGDVKQMLMLLEAQMARRYGDPWREPRRAVAAVDPAPGVVPQEAPKAPFDDVGEPSELGLMKVLTAGFESVVVTADVREEGIVGAVSIRVAGENKVLKALRPGGAFSIYRAIQDRPQYLMSGRVDPKLAWGLVEEIARGAGGLRDLAELRNAVREGFGFDLDEELLPLLNGDAGLVVLGEIDRSSRHDFDGPRVLPFGGGITVGVSDEAKAQTLVDRALGRPMFQKLAKQNGKDGWLVDVPGVGTLNVAVRGGAIVVTNRPAILASMGGSGTLDTKIAPLNALLGRANVAAAWAMDTSFVGLWFLRGGYAESATSARPGPIVSTPELVEKRRQLEALRSARQKDDDAHQKLEETHISAITAAFGLTAMVVEPTEAGLTFRGGQYVGAASMAEASKRIATAIGELARSNLASEKARAEFWRKQDELRQEVEVLENAAQRAAAVPEVLAVPPTEVAPVLDVPPPPVPPPGRPGKEELPW